MPISQFAKRAETRDRAGDLQIFSQNIDMSLAHFFWPGGFLEEFAKTLDYRTGHVQDLARVRVCQRSKGVGSYTQLGSNWQPSTGQADVIATRPWVHLLHL